MNDQYDIKLKEIDFYKTHPEYLPFVGNKFDEFKSRCKGQQEMGKIDKNY